MVYKLSPVTLSTLYKSLKVHITGNVVLKGGWNGFHFSIIVKRSTRLQAKIRTVVISNEPD